MHISNKNDDKCLLRKVANGDEQAFGCLFDIYKPGIYTTALKITGDEWAAEEILQDTFLKVWLNKDKLIYIENIGGWIYTISKNVTYNLIKRTQREKINFSQFIQEAIPLNYEDATNLTYEKELQSILSQAINRLPLKQQLTYKLIKQQEMKREEAALKMNVSPETVKWNLDKAMKSIRAFCVASMEGAPLIFIICVFLKNIFR